jgi:hypothetical protein
VTDSHRPFNAVRVTFSEHRLVDLPERRPLSAWERDAITRMIDHEPDIGRCAYEQASSAVTAAACLDCPTITLSVDSDVCRLSSLAGSDEARWGVVTASLHAKQDDGVLIVAMLHVMDGLLAELVVYRPAGEPLGSPPPLTSFEIVMIPLPSGDLPMRG